MCLQPLPPYIIQLADPHNGQHRLLKLIATAGKALPDKVPQWLSTTLTGNNKSRNPLITPPYAKIVLGLVLFAVKIQVSALHKAGQTSTGRLRVSSHLPLTNVSNKDQYNHISQC